MSREIKFRGQRVDSGEWVYGYYYELDGTPYIIEKGTGFFDIRCGETIFGTAYIHEIIPETVGQYTGQNDKNSKEIYEGDILSNKWCFSKNGVASFGTYKDWHMRENFQCGNVGFYVEVDDTTRKDLMYFALRSEIIGNTYENPELLESEVSE